MNFKDKRLWIGIVVVVIFIYWFIIVPYGFNLTCLIDNKFPENYETNDVIIYSSLSTMVGRYDIVIYGNGDAYYLYRIKGEVKSKSGNLTQEKVEEIIDLFKENNFFCLNERYSPLIPATDMGTNYVSITVNGEVKTVNDYGRIAPPQFHHIVEELKKSVEELPPVNSSEVCHVIYNELEKVSYWRGTRENFCYGY